MGNRSSRSQDHHVFEKELEVLNEIVSGIINEKDVFKNNDYNFLSHDVCDAYQVVLEDELQKHLKLHIKSLGSSLYIIPKDDDTRMTKMNLTKKQVCEKISNHYIKILYIMSLVKYVYSLESAGDMSIAGIVFRNIRVLDDIMEINFCDLPHKNYAFNGTEAYKIDFAKLEGFRFFVEYVLSKPEAHVFLGLVRSVLGRNNKNKITTTICGSFASKTLSSADLRDIEAMYMSKFGTKLRCHQMGGNIRPSKNTNEQDVGTNISKRSLSLNIFINKDNPIFAKDICFAPRKVIIKTSTKEGRVVFDLYNILRQNYLKNVKSVESILKKLVMQQRDGSYALKDIDKVTLDNIIGEMKTRIKLFYIQSIIDYQNLLDKAKLIPSIEFSE